ncbi:serine hydrolase [Aquimarina sp. 2201CG14-23]|uniref:serine hydrolase n=1 Tax=Aquimarina mycalae TaxID=3040073 RepID=UPI0024780472|nr:serine hydrolase [Aquimarina sp. 2201CG14-23]MDH7445528.1 serine hydrolase [Aquimarina sp. 2201CG14-23]
MKKNIIRISFILLVVLLSWGTITTFISEPKTLDELMRSYENPTLNIKIRSPFSGTILVAKKSEIIFHKAYGESNREASIPNTIDTKFGIGSITKQFTVMLVMQLVEKGQIQLQDTITQYLPYLPKRLTNKITIHQLLSHTSGLPHYNGLQAIGISLQEFGNTKYTPKELAQLIGQTKLINKPGTSYSYSSLGYDLLGVILEEVSGKTYAQLLDESIVKPLGLKNTGFADNEYVEKHLAKGYSYKEVYGWEWWSSEHGGKTTEAPFRDQSTAYATGGIHSTVKDLFIWSEAVKSNQLLSPEFSNIMWTPNKKGYCYGWVRNWDDIIEKNTKVALYGHGGALAGNSSFIALYDDETTIIYLANRSNLKAEEIIHQVYLRANNLKDEYRLKGYPNRDSYSKFIKSGGIVALQNYFNTLSKHSGYTVHPSRSTMKGVINIHLEAGKINIADSLKNAFLTKHNPEENLLNSLGYDFLYSDYPEFSLDFFKTSISKYPHSSNAWDSLGEAYLVLKKYKKSIECYSKAVAIAERVSHPQLENYKQNLKTAQLKGTAR